LTIEHTGPQISGSKSGVTMGNMPTNYRYRKASYDDCDISFIDGTFTYAFTHPPDGAAPSL